MPRNLRQNVVILVVVLSFFALSFATGVESAQTSRNRVKATPTPAKKSAKTTPTAGKKTTAKATPTPGKKTQAKAAPTPKKSSPSTAKAKLTDKKTAAKSPAKETSKDKSAKNKTTAKTKETTSKKVTPSKKETVSKSNQKTTDKKSAGSKSTKSEPKTASKSGKPEPKTAAKSSKPVTTAKNLSPSNKTKPTKTPVKENTSSKPAARTPVKAPEKTSAAAAAPQIIVTDISARIRSQARAGAPEVKHAKLGTILQVAEKTPAWYRVQFSSGSKTSSGWISANSVNDLNSAAKDQLYRQITERYYKGEGMDFATASELYEFLTRAVGDLGTSSSAEIELKRLLALRSALKAVPSGKAAQNPYREFLKTHEKSVVYSEPSGEWLVSSTLFWELHKKYAKSPLADQIAWEGAQNPLPGECEGYVNCHLFYARMTSGEYLSLHPTGKKNLAALTDLTNLLEPIAASLTDRSVYTGPTDVTDRAEFNNLIAELRTIVSRLPLTEKEKPLQQLKKIAEGFR